MDSQSFLEDILTWVTPLQLVPNYWRNSIWLGWRSKRLSFNRRELTREAEKTWHHREVKEGKMRATEASEEEKVVTTTREQHGMKPTPTISD